MSVTVVILTRDEEQFIEAAIQSALNLSPSVIVLDSGSSDHTIALAEEAGATIRKHPFEGFASQRQVALGLVDTEWTLFLDADERLLPGSIDEIRSTLEDVGDSTAGFWIPRRNLAFGHVVKGGGWWPDYQLRLLRTERASYEASEEIHEVATVDGDTFTLNHPMIHINYLSRLEFIRKQWHYAAHGVGAGQKQPRPRRRAYLSAPAREFWRRFIELHGVRDGFTGVFMASVMAVASVRRVWLERRATTVGSAVT